MKRLFFVLLILLTVATGCRRDDDGELYVPRVATNLTININLPGYSALANPGGYAYVVGGSRGIVVYRTSLSDFAAFDRHCTYNVIDGCKVSVLDGIIAEDTTCCRSRFDIISGFPVSGEADRQLQSYNTTFNPNANLLRIYN